MLKFFLCASGRKCLTDPITVSHIHGAAHLSCVHTHNTYAIYIYILIKLFKENFLIKIIQGKNWLKELQELFVLYLPTFL